MLRVWNGQVNESGGDGRTPRGQLSKHPDFTQCKKTPLFASLVTRTISTYRKSGCLLMLRVKHTGCDRCTCERMSDRCTRPLQKRREAGHPAALLLTPAGSIMRRMGFSETIFLFFLALLIFGPKKLPEIARQAGKILNDLRRASNEFKAQIESEISHLEREQLQRTLPASEKPKNTVAALPSASGTSSSGQADQSAMARVPDA